MFVFKRLLVTAFIVLVCFSCSQKTELTTTPIKLAVSGNRTAKFENIKGKNESVNVNELVIFSESFEKGRKKTVTTQKLSLDYGTWYFQDAKIDSVTDKKIGNKSLVLENEGFAIMDFDWSFAHSKIKPEKTIIKIRHATSGGEATWKLIASSNSGSNWKYLGEEVKAESTMNTAVFEVTDLKNERLGILKTKGSGKIFIDELEVIFFTKPSLHLTFGNPSDAKQSNTSNYLITRPGYALSYSEQRGTANWVSWYLDNSWVGSSGRCNCFEHDPSLSSDFSTIEPTSYYGSGFHRGHLCPSGDRTIDGLTNKNTFYMTNIVPQAPDNNVNAWRILEEYGRSLASQGNELYIVAGVGGKGGTGRNGEKSTIANGRITVPEYLWKVILVLPKGENDVSRVTTDTRIIAVIIPNKQGIGEDWQSYRTSVDEIEKRVNIDLYEAIPDKIEDALEKKVDGK